MHDLGRWQTSTGHELAFSVCELRDGTPVVTIKAPESIVDDIFVDKVPSGVTAADWAVLGDRLKLADPALFAQLFNVLAAAADDPTSARNCPALRKAAS